MSLGCTSPSKFLRCAAFARVLLGFALLHGAVDARADTSGSKEYELKAAFLYNFTKFVVWPPACFPEATSPIIIGVYGKNPFGGGLADAIRARKVDGREIVLRPVATLEETAGVHLLFVPAAADPTVDAVLKTVCATSVLTVGETEAFQKEGGIITFIVAGDKLRFVIDIGAAERAGLKISAQLQKLAHRVRRPS